jgi:hypothetical protein
VDFRFFKMAAPRPKEHRPAMLVSPDHNVFLGGREFFYPNEPTVHLGWANHPQADSYIGFEIHIPTANPPGISTARGPHRENIHVVGAFFFQDVTAQSRLLSACGPNLQRFLPKGENPAEWRVVRIEGTPKPQNWPMPFFGEAKHRGWMEDGVIKGHWRLSNLLTKPGVFWLIVRPGVHGKIAVAMENVRHGRFEYPGVSDRYVTPQRELIFANVVSTNWDMLRFQREIPRLLGREQYRATLLQSRFKHVAISLMQAVVQDVFTLSEEINQIRAIRHTARYFNVESEPSRLYALFRLPDTFVSVSTACVVHHLISLERAIC